MRFEIVTDTYAPDINGVAMTLGRLVKGLKQRGHYVYVHHTVGECASGASLPSVSLPGYEQVRVGLPGRLKFLRRWRKKRPDAIYVATESLLGLSAIRAAKTLSIPVVAGFHTNFDQYVRNYRMEKLSELALSYLRKVHNLADLTFAPTRDVVDRLVEEGFHHVKKLGRGVDTELFSPSKRSEALRRTWGVEKDSPVLLMVGRVAPEKNLELGIEAFYQLQKQIPSARCVIVGDGPDLEKLKAEHPKVIFTGPKVEEELAQHYASCEILLFPSETETFGNVLMEGLASGLATVSYDYAASRTHLEDGVSGLKAELGDEQGFISATLKLEDVSLRHHLAENGALVVKELSWEQVVTTFESELSELAKKNAVQRRQHVDKLAPLPFKTVIMSDIHLGSPNSKAKEAAHFLKHITCEKLILNGDIIDGWALQKGSKWKKSHTRFVRTVLNKTEKDIQDVIYVRGNHDDIMDKFLPIAFSHIHCVAEYEYVTKKGEKYLVVHGDGFDSVSTKWKWAAEVGAVGYDALMSVNHYYNRFRQWRGKRYVSLSKKVKAKVKGAIAFIDQYEELLQEYARERNCDGIICGHIHTPANEHLNDIHYLNSGDWVESLTAIVEHLDGGFEVISYEDFLKRLYHSGEELEKENQILDEMEEEMKHDPTL